MHLRGRISAERILTGIKVGGLLAEAILTGIKVGGYQVVVM